MFFRNLQIYSIAPTWSPTPAAIEEAMSRHPLLPCTAAAMQSQGWVPPTPESGLVFDLDGKQMMIALGLEQKILPTSVINQTAKDRAVELEQKQGSPLGRKQMRDLKDRIADELRPKALVRKRTVRAWIDLARHRFVVEATTPKLAEDLATVLRSDFGEFPIWPLATRVSAASAMTIWVSGGSAPSSFALQDDCELIADNAEKSTVRYVRHGLDGPELKALIGGGKSVGRVGLLWRERVDFVLTDRLAVKRIKHLAMTTKAEETVGSEEREDSFEANFTLMTGELSSLLDDVVDALGGQVEE